MNTLSTLRSCLRAADSSRTCLPPFARAFSTTTPCRREDGAKEKQNEAGKPKGNTSSTPPPFATPPNLESTELPPPPDPSLQQRRHRHVSKEALDCVTCVGWDGAASGGDWNVDYKEYYEKHKPSPLSEIEMVDTRKPITKAMDGRQEEGIRAALVEDTVDAALERAERMFREAAARGDPEAPHSRALARLLALRRSNTSNDLSI